MAPVPGPRSTGTRSAARRELHKTVTNPITAGSLGTPARTGNRWSPWRCSWRTPARAAAARRLRSLARSCAPLSRRGKSNDGRGVGTSEVAMIGPGTVLGGRHRLEERIASGGMGDVWRGFDDVLGRTVAIKILLPSLLEEAGFTERFRVEARTMATINHPGVVDVYDYGSDPSVGAYLVMKYVDGDALSRTLNKVHRLTPARTMALVAQAADALHAAHENNAVHRG